MTHLILASSSPQRKELLSGLGIPFDVVPSGVSEDACTVLDPALRAQCLARWKAEDVHEKHADAYVFGCDTLVVASDGTLLEKPKDAADAERMLELQSAKISTVHSALCLIDPAGQIHEGLSSSAVHFRKLSTDEKKWWIGTEQWKDRSGAFQIDGKGQLLISHLEGDWTSVVGLPVYLLGNLLKKAGFPL